MTDNAILQAAYQLYDAGLCVLPAAADGSKRPAVPWKEWQHRRPPREQLATWFTPGVQGLGVVCGQVSGGLEMLELEGRAMAEGIAADLSARAQACGLGELLGRVLGGYCELTPSGGIHLLYRVVAGEVHPNTKLARRPATNAELAENPGEKVKVLIETRGEGGWVILAPSGGSTHPSGRPWQLVAGGPATIPVITPEERDALHELAKSFDQMPIPAEPAFTQPGSGWDDGEGLRAGDDFNQRTTWSELLVPRGWRRVYERGGVTYWCRPGKERGISATTGRGGADNLYVFSTSTEFEPERPYDKFGAYALLTQGSTTPEALRAAARELAAQGYGRPRPEPTRPAPVVTPPPLVTGGREEQEEGGQPGPSVQVVSEPPRTYAQSDDGLALDLVDSYGEVIRYCPDRGRWLAWDGRRWEWQPPGGGIVREYAKAVARALPEDGRAAVAHKKRALSATGTGAVLAQAQTDPRIVVPYAALDAHDWELNTPAGIVDLRTGELGPSDASRLHTKITACAPDPGADPGRWTEFLDQTFGGDTELIAYLQRLVGYSATGSTAKHVLPFCVGSGGNGKGVFLESLIGVLGDYASTAPAGFLMSRASVSHETEIARLAGMRMVVCSEVSEDDKFDEAKVKLLTGGDSITARFMRQDHFTFKPTHHLWLMGNHQPKVRAGGRSFWRRLRLIPFEHEVPEEKVVDDLQGILVRDHGPALLAWIVAGAAAFASRGLAEPERVKAATGAYEADQDTVSRFVADRCHLAASPDVQIKVARLREEYERWCVAEGETPVNPKRLTMELRRHGVEVVKGSKGVRFYTGITLLADEDEAPAPGGPDGPRHEAPVFAGLGGGGW